MLDSSLHKSKKYRGLFPSQKTFLTEYFTSFYAQNPKTVKFCVVQKRRSTDHNSIKL